MLVLLRPTRGPLLRPSLQTRTRWRCYHATQALWRTDDDQASEHKKNWLISKLTETFRQQACDVPSGKKRYSGVIVRPQIVSPKLCDDVLSYIGRSLEKHKGCDILDLNPGAGLWSSKLHDFLKPRNHVLLESDPKLFRPYLQPLVDQPGSTYRFVEGDPTLYSTFDKLIDDGYFPDQTRIDPGDSRAQEPNNTLLVTGTLMWNPKLPGMGFDSVARQIHGAFARMAWRNEGFHAMGPARMLFWILSEDIKRALPRGVHGTGKNTAVFMKTTDMVEVVSPGHPDPRAWFRSARYEIESLIQAMKRAKEAGIELPAHRRENIHDFADDVARMTKGTGNIGFAELNEYLRKQEESGKSTEGITLGQHRQLWIREKAFKANPPPPPQRTSKRGAPRVSDEQRNLNKVRASVTRHSNVRQKIDQAVDLGERIYQQECLILSTPDGARKEKETLKLKKLQTEFHEAWENIDKNIRTLVFGELDDRLMLRSPGPRLQWDERPFEPLVLQPDEIYPPVHASLVDNTPRPRPADESIEDFEYFTDFTTALVGPTDSIIDVMDNVQHGASELTEQVPALRDPKKGGRLDLSQLRVRNLTPEMIQGLCKAYREWPFRNPDAATSNYFRSRASTPKVKGIKLSKF